MKTKLIPFKRDMIPEAGKLLAKRHQRDRQVFPCMPDRFESPDIAKKAITNLLEKKHSRGYAAMRRNKMVAYFLGTNTNQPWGRCGWVYLPGSALSAGEPVEIMQDLYALMGDDWVKRGVFIHHIYLPNSDDRLMDAWFGLDFGKERVDAILDLNTVEIPEIEIPEGIKIRRGGPGDNEHLGGMSHLIMRELEKSPYFHPTPPEEFADLYDGWSELADDITVDVWLAFEGDKIVATIASWATMHPEEDTDTEIFASENTFSFSVAATQPESRGRGIMTAMTWTCLKYNRDRGYEYCYTNWISPNLAASRFWPRFGYQEVAYRLTKNINPMIAWTREF